MKTNLREFDLGDVIRYGVGPTALMRITSISRDAHSRLPLRYYGEHILGGSVGASFTDAKAPSDEDVQSWAKHHPDRALLVTSPLEWAVRTFGPVARNRDERALRLLEEAIEFAQAEGVSLDVVTRQVQATYAKPPGDPRKELRAVAMTLHAAAENRGTTIEDAVAEEFERVLQIPQEEWDRRHGVKAADGRANLSEVLHVDGNEIAAGPIEAPCGGLTAAQMTEQLDRLNGDAA